MATPEEYVEVEDEPRHLTVLLNEHVRLIRVRFPARDATLYHRHSRDSFYVHLATASLGNAVVGAEPCVLNLSFGGVAYGGHLEKPFVHKISGISEDAGWDCIDGELLKTPPVLPEAPMQHDKFKLILESPRVRMYEASLSPADPATEVDFHFYSVLTAMSECEIDINGTRHLLTTGDVLWLEPFSGPIRAMGSPLRVYLTEIHA